MVFLHVRFPVGKPHLASELPVISQYAGFASRLWIERSQIDPRIPRFSAPAIRNGLMLLSCNAFPDISIAPWRRKKRFISSSIHEGGSRVRRMFHALFRPLSARTSLADHRGAGIRQGGCRPSRERTASPAFGGCPGHRPGCPAHPYRTKPEPCCV